MQRNLASGFDDSFRRHLAVEQRRAVLETIAHELTPDTTLGDIVDAAQDLGWADNLGELSLSDLAVALLGGDPPTTSAAAPVAAPADDEDEDEDEEAGDDEDEDAETDEDEDEEEEEAEEAAPAKRGRKKAEPVAAQRKPSSLDRALDRIDKALAARRKAPKAGKGAKAGKVASKVTKAGKKLAKKAAVKRPVEADDDTDAMSLEQAAKLLVPLVRKLREATMQDLEEQTHMGRRKLRFHIGQLVKHGRLKRHGMGRGTCYTVK